MSRGPDRRQRRLGHAEVGSVSIEAAIVFAVVMVTFFSLMIAAGRILSSENQVRSAAHAAARAASLEPNYDDAVGAATDIGGNNLTEAGLVCVGAPSIEVTSDAGHFIPGGWVQVEISCTPNVLPFGLTPRPYAYQATEVIDEFRSEP